MVEVSSGSFTMGATDSEYFSMFAGSTNPEGPQHRVDIGYAFAVGVYEVTFAEWNACLDAGGCGVFQCGDQTCGEYRPGDEGWGRDTRPVIYVDWDDAQLYADWLSAYTGARYRLLSEAEWEYVARAGTTGPFHFGDTISPDQANYNGDVAWTGLSTQGVNRRQTVPVGSFPPNALGLHDVHGNVSEWTQDCWNGSYAGAPADGSAWETGDCPGSDGLYSRVMRGGSWSDISPLLRSSFRTTASNNARRKWIGFRVARDLAP